MAEHDIPELGKMASVVIDPHTHAPCELQFGRTGEGLRSLDEEFEGDPERGESLVDEISIVSRWSLHVALYALQNPAPENIRKALSMIGTSGDCEEHVDFDTLRPLPVSEPPGWDDPLYVHPADSDEERKVEPNLKAAISAMASISAATGRAKMTLQNPDIEGFTVNEELDEITAQVGVLRKALASLSDAGEGGDDVR